MNIVEKMKKDWDRRASHHARYWIATEDYRTDEAFERSGEETARALVSILEDRGANLSSLRVLDVGCGIGRVLKPMASRVREIVGIDVSKEMIEQSRKWLKEVTNATTREGSGVDLEGLEDGSFDCVYSYVAFQHMPRPVFRRYLAESHRVLRDGGLLAFQIYVGERKEPPLGDTISLRVYEQSELDEWLRASGFRIVEARREHRTSEGLESFLVLAARAEALTSRPDDEAWLEENPGDFHSPMDSHLYRHLVRNQMASGGRSEAIETLKRHFEFDPGELSVGLELTALLVEQGRIEEAIRVLEAVTSVHASFADGYLSLAQLYVLSGQRAKAADVIDRLRASFPGDESLHQRAVALFGAALTRGA